MNKFENEIYHLLRNNYKVAGTTNLCKKELKEEICINLLKYLKKEDNVEVKVEKVGLAGTESFASGSLLLKEYNIEILIEVRTNCIRAYAKYLGSEEKNKDSGKYLLGFSGELAKSIMKSKQFKYFEEFLKVKTIEYIYELVDRKLLAGENLIQNIYF